MDILPPLSEEDRMLSGLCYPLWPLAAPMVLLGARREEPFVHFHALQGLALGLLSSGGCLLLAAVIWVILKVLPGGSPTFSGIVGLGVFSGGFFVLAFYGSFLFYTAWRVGDGRFLRLPLVGTWAEARMQANLGLGPEDYRVDPLPAPAKPDDSEVRHGEPSPFEPERLTRQHRPSQMPATPKRPRRLAFQEVEEPESRVQTSVAPAAQVPEPTDEQGFQPGLFSPGQTSGSRQFRWEALDPEEERPESTSDGEFRAW